MEILRFEEAVAAEPAPIEQDRSYGCLERSKYDLQVERFLQYHALGQTQFLTPAALLQNPLARPNGSAAAARMQEAAQPAGTGAKHCF